jgi:cation transport ATPase
MSRRFWVGSGARVAGARAGDGPSPVQRRRPCAPAHQRVDSVWLATPVVLWAGWPFFERGYASLVNRSLNMFTLIALGTGVAWTYSVVALLFPSAFPPEFRGPHGEVSVYFEAAAVITVLVLLGQVLELGARERTGGAIRALLDSRPRPRGASAMARKKPKYRWTPSWSATGCVSARVRRRPLTASSLTGARRSTSPW